MTFAPPRDLYPFRSNWHEQAGSRLHYLDEGSGPAVLMLHGNPTWSFLYRNLITELRATHRCIVPDYPLLRAVRSPSGVQSDPSGARPPNRFPDPGSRP